MEEELVEEAHLLFGPVVDNGDEEAVVLRGAAGPREEVHLRGVVVLHVVHLGWGGARSPTHLVLGGVADVLLDEGLPGVVYGGPAVHHAVAHTAVTLVYRREVKAVDEPGREEGKV